jgi:glycosyltransferase involved in cell wall biosynthesis
MRLSFVIPTRNQARFIRQCIDGCLQQGIADSEIVVMDGASTDGTQDVLAAYGDRVRWRSERDRGQSDAINKGIREARGELVAWINSDDYYASPDAIRTLIAAFDADPSVDIAYGDGERVDVAGASLGLHRSPVYTDAASLVANPLTFVLQPCLVFRRSLFLDVGGLDESLHYAMDYELWLRMFPAARRSVHIDRVIACARYHADAKSVAALGPQIVEACRIKLAAAKRLSVGREGRARMYASMARLAAYWLAVRVGLRSTTG